jgi:arsenite methyltransferase
VNDALKEQVRERYAAAATQATSGSASCCGPTADAPDDTGCCGPAVVDASVSPTADVDEPGWFGADLYEGSERDELPQAAVLASLGCGNPTAVAELREGETVLDLGSGGGIDVLLSARRVGPTGHAIGIDMTDEMLALARANVAEAGVDNVEFVRGEIEDLPLGDGTVDVIISNCSSTRMGAGSTSSSRTVRWPPEARSGKPSSRSPRRGSGCSSWTGAGTGAARPLKARTSCATVRTSLR